MNEELEISVLGELLLTEASAFSLDSMVKEIVEMLREVLKAFDPIFEQSGHIGIKLKSTITKAFGTSKTTADIALMMALIPVAVTVLAIGYFETKLNGRANPEDPYYKTVIKWFGAGTGIILGTIANQIKQVLGLGKSAVKSVTDYVITILMTVLVLPSFMGDAIREYRDKVINRNDSMLKKGLRRIGLVEGTEGSFANVYGTNKVITEEDIMETVMDSAFTDGFVTNLEESNFLENSPIDLVSVVKVGLVVVIFAGIHGVSKKYVNFVAIHADVNVRAGAKAKDKFDDAKDWAKDAWDSTKAKATIAWDWIVEIYKEFIGLLQVTKFDITHGLLFAKKPVQLSLVKRISYDLLPGFGLLDSIVTGNRTFDMSVFNRSEVKKFNPYITRDGKSGIISADSYQLLSKRRLIADKYTR